MQCQTPRPNKRVRFSDPGPTTHELFDYSTGLTPALCRTSFEERDPDSAVQRTPTRTRAARRRSTPLPKSRRISDSQLPGSSGSPERVLHFTPLRQLLDTRTQRRIRRIGLSDEITNLEREKRAANQYEKSLEMLLRERDFLKQELEVVKKEKSTPESQLPTSNRGWMTPVSSPMTGHVDQRTTSFSDTDTVDTIMINDSGFEGDTIFMSDSPDLRAADGNPNLPNDFALFSPKDFDVDASTQTAQFDAKDSPEFISLSTDLRAAQKEKRDLFEACRSRHDLLEGTVLERHLKQTSPPPDFLDDILPSLMQTLAHASNATGTLNAIQDELSGLGFHGANASESIQDLRNRFRTARLKLEHAVPGETAEAGLNDGSSTLSALVKRIETLVKDLGEERTRHRGTTDREKALRGQFDTLLARYETASKKIEDLEESITSSAGDMLHTRMRMQELERETQEQATGIDRLNTALSKYHDEVKSLEDLVTKLEDEKIQSFETHTRERDELEQKITNEHTARRAAELIIAGKEKQIRELEEVIEQNRIQVCDLTAKVENIEREYSQAVEALVVEHDQEVGSRNVRIAELTTSLEAAKAEAEKLSRSNAGLEEQLQMEVDSRDNLLDTWVAEQTRAYASMKAAVSATRRKSKARAANWELKSDELQSECLGIGSEPITPISMTRFVNVEAGRGKHRRRLDSGIGILTEDELDDEVEAVGLPSDPADL
ncbi:hypothetical protein BJY04DRAFT_214054 [Aspergillus karnatakaensis]|uniref:uncharacterized protein n=1 Tax=Aspergillus karnatakaensis TaxID=1810916 RepID=UPI003CCD6A79